MSFESSPSLKFQTTGMTLFCPPSMLPLSPFASFIFFANFGAPSSASAEIAFFFRHQSPVRIRRPDVRSVFAFPSGPLPVRSLNFRKELRSPASRASDVTGDLQTGLCGVSVPSAATRYKTGANDTFSLDKFLRQTEFSFEPPRFIIRRMLLLDSFHLYSRRLVLRISPFATPACASSGGGESTGVRVLSYLAISPSALLFAAFPQDPSPRYSLRSSTARRIVVLR